MKTFIETLLICMSCTTYISKATIASIATFPCKKAISFLPIKKSESFFTKLKYPE